MLWLITKAVYSLSFLCFSIFDVHNCPKLHFFAGKEELAAESVGDALYKWNFTGRDVQGLFEEIWRLGD